MGDGERGGTGDKRRTEEEERWEMGKGEEQAMRGGGGKRRREERKIRGRGELTHKHTLPVLVHRHSSQSLTPGTLTHSQWGIIRPGNTHTHTRPKT